MPKFSKEDLDHITTVAGLTAAICLGLASTIASTLSAIPGDKVMGVSKVPFTAAGSFLGGIGALALGVGGVFTNKTASMHPTTTDLERRASVQEQADYFKYSPNHISPPPQTVDTAISSEPLDDDETYYLLSEHLPANSAQNFDDAP